MGSAASASAGAATVSDVPHWPQKRWPAGLTKPQLRQTWPSRAPHWPQYFIPGRFSDPQCGHIIQANPCYRTEGGGEPAAHSPPV